MLDISKDNQCWNRKSLFFRSFREREINVVMSYYIESIEEQTEGICSVYNRMHNSTNISDNDDATAMESTQSIL